MCNDQEDPTIIQDLTHGFLNMAVAIVLRWKQVARLCIMAFLQKRVTYIAGELAGDKDSKRRRACPRFGVLNPIKL